MNLKSLILATTLLTSSNYSNFIVSGEYHYDNYQEINTGFVNMEASFLSDLNVNGSLFTLSFFAGNFGDYSEFTLTGFGSDIVGYESDYYFLNVEDIVKLKNYSLENQTNTIAWSYIVGFGEYDLNEDSIPIYYSILLMDLDYSHELLSTSLIYSTLGGLSERMDPNQIEYIEDGEIEAIGTNDTLLSFINNNVELVESPSLTSNIFDIIGTSIGEYLNLLPQTFNDLVAVFYVDNKFTFVGIITLMTFGIGITKWAFNFVKEKVRL